MDCEATDADGEEDGARDIVGDVLGLVVEPVVGVWDGSGEKTAGEIIELRDMGR